MERYTAFISYRHKPTDMAVAARLHRLMEHYKIPQALRKDGKKTLGKVFRDRDELSLDSNLTQRLRDALDASDYLIVICTPDTPDSPWVTEEITYFLKNHAEDRVFTVLADGDPERSFPAALTQEFDADGNVIHGRTHEPLAANAAADTDRERLRKLDDEFLRLVAPILGCTYDELYQREVRYRRKRRITAIGTAAAIALAFISVLAVKNAQIRAQYRQTQINESNALAKVSMDELQNGNAFQALQTAYSAVPGETDRPLTTDAQIALAKSLYAYQPMAYRADISVELYSTVKKAMLSPDGGILGVLDDFDDFFAYDAYTGEQLWNVNCTNYGSAGSAEVFFLKDQNAVLYKDDQSFTVYDQNTGSRSRTVFFKDHPKTKYGYCAECALSPDSRLLACSFNGESDTPVIVFYDVASGESVSVTEGLSSDYFFAMQDGVFSSDGKTFFAVYHDLVTGNYDLLKINTENGNVVRTNTLASRKSGYLYATEFNLVYLDDYAGQGNALFVVCKEQTSSDRTQYALIYDNEQDWTNTLMSPDADLAYESPVFVFDDGYRIYTYGGSKLVNFGRNDTSLLTTAYSSDVVTVFASSDPESAERYVLMKNGRFLRMKPSYSETGSGIVEEYALTDFSIAAAYHSGVEGEPICIIPEDRTNTVCIYRIRGDESGVALPWPEQMGYIGHYGEVYAFPDGKRFLYADSDGFTEKDFYHYYFTVYNAVDAAVEKTVHLRVPSDQFLYDPVGISADGGKVLFQNYVLDLAAETVTRITVGDEKRYLNEKANAAYHGASDRIYADLDDNRVVWWVNGENPTLGKEYGERISFFYMTKERQLSVKEQNLVVGGSGLVAMPAQGEDADVYDTFLIYSTGKDAWNRIRLAGAYEPYPLAYAVGGEKELLAVAEPDNTIRFYDMDHDTSVREFPLMLPAYSIREMRFILGDDVLALHQCSADGKSGHRLWFIDARDGAILYSLAMNKCGSTASLAIQADAEKQQLYVWDETSLMGVGYVLSLSAHENWQLLYEIPQCFGFLPDLGKVVNWTPEHAEMLLRDIYDINALAARAKQETEARKERRGTAFGATVPETSSAAEPSQTEAPAQARIAQTEPGNSGNNLRTGNGSAEDAEYYYIQSQNMGGIKRISKADGKEERILAEGAAQYLNAVDSWIYYLDRDGAICRVPKNGITQERILKAEAKNLLYLNGRLYFCRKENGDCNIYSCLPDGSDQTPVLKDVLGYDDYVIENDRIWFADGGDNYGDLCTAPLGGGQTTVLLSDLNGESTVFRSPVAADGWIYFNASQGIGRVRPDGTECTLLVENESVYFYVVNAQTVYFNTFSNDNAACIYGYSPEDGSLQTPVRRNSTEGGFADLALYQDAFVYKEYEGGVSGKSSVVICDLSDKTLQTKQVVQ